MKSLFFYSHLATALLTGLVMLAACESEREDPPRAKVNLGILKICAQMGALTRQIAVEKNNGASKAALYEKYQPMLARQNSRLKSVNFSLGLGYDIDDLQPDTLRNLANQLCVATYEGYNKLGDYQKLYQLAKQCEQESITGKTQLTTDMKNLNRCMGRHFQEFTANPP